jgi:hypothetical protein
MWENHSAGHDPSMGANMILSTRAVSYFLVEVGYGLLVWDSLHDDAETEWDYAVTFLFEEGWDIAEDPCHFEGSMQVYVLTR